MTREGIIARVGRGLENAWWFDGWLYIYDGVDGYGLVMPTSLESARRWIKETNAQTGLDTPLVEGCDGIASTLPGWRGETELPCLCCGVPEPADYRVAVMLRQLAVPLSAQRRMGGDTCATGGAKTSPA